MVYCGNFQRTYSVDCVERKHTILFVVSFSVAMARMLRNLGEKHFQMLVGTGIGFLFGASLIPQTVLLKKYRGVLASYKDGEEEPVAEDLLELKDKVSQHRDIIWKGSWQNTYILLVSRKTMFLCVISRDKMADFILFIMLEWWGKCVLRIFTYDVRFC